MPTNYTGYTGWTTASSYYDMFTESTRTRPDNEKLAEYIEKFIKLEKRRKKKLSVSKRDRETIRDILGKA